MNKGIIKSDQFELQYSIEGSGKHKILVIGSAVYYPKTFSQQLKNRFKFIFIDHRGFAKCRSGCTKNDFKLCMIIDDIELIRKKLNLGKVIILGHSGHGFMALEYAKKYPDNISKVILISMGPSTSLANQKLADEYFEKNASQDRKNAQAKCLEDLESAIKQAPGRKFIIFCLKLGPRSWYNYNYDASKLWQDVNIDQEAFDYLWGEVFADIDITEGCSNLNIPILLLLGKHDYLVAPYYTWDSIIEKFKNIRIILFSKCGHTPQLECPDEFDKEIIKFIDD